MRGLLAASGPARPEQRLPLIEMAFPALKRRPPEFVEKVLLTVESMSQADERVDVFEYLLARMIQRDLWESSNPHIARASGRKTLKACRREAVAVMSVLARHGHSEEDAVKAAFRAGAAALDAVDANLEQQASQNWAKALDAALPVLDQLRPTDKKQLVEALLAVALHDEELRPTELELLRVVCELIHVPLPILQ